MRDSWKGTRSETFFMPTSTGFPKHYNHLPEAATESFPSARKPKSGWMESGTCFSKTFLNKQRNIVLLYVAL